MEIQNIRTYIKNNLLTTSESAEILQLSKARITKLVEEGALSPIKKSSQGLLFLRSDIMLYLNARNRVNVSKNTPIFIKDTTTNKCVSKFREHRSELGMIESIQVFFNNYDAILCGYYTPADYDWYGEHNLIESPLFVIRDVNGKEIWLSGCNCGYGGTGPHGTASILRYLRDENTLTGPEFTDEAIEKLIFFKRISIIKDDNDGWDVYKLESSIPTIAADATMFYYKDNLVLVQDVNDYRYESNYQVLEAYQSFLPDPSQIIVFPTDRMAEEYGYVLHNHRYSYPKAIYNIILIDGSGRQIWLRDNFKNKETLLHNPSIKKILEVCNFPYDPEKLLQSEHSTLQRISKWMNVIFNNEPDKPIIIEHKE